MKKSIILTKSALMLGYHTIFIFQIAMSRIFLM